MSWESDVFICCYCGKQFPNDPAKLALHMRNTHEIERGQISNAS